MANQGESKLDDQSVRELAAKVKDQIEEAGGHYVTAVIGEESHTLATNCSMHDGNGPGDIVTDK